MENIFPNGVFYWNPSESVLLGLGITLLFSAWVIYSIFKTEKLFYKIFFSVALVWNIFMIYLDLFYVFLPVSNGVLSTITTLFWIGALSTFIFDRKSKSFSH